MYECIHRIIGDPYREKFVYKEEIDVALEEKKDKLIKLYERYSHTKIPRMFIPKNLMHKGMTIEEFLEMLDYADVLDQTLSLREAKISYVGSLPMMENVVITPHLSLSFFDFCEALVRSAHIIYDSLGEPDGNPVMPMLRKLEEGDDADEDVCAAISDILQAFIDDLFVTKKKEVKSREESREGRESGRVSPTSIAPITEEPSSKGGAKADSRAHRTSSQNPHKLNDVISSLGHAVGVESKLSHIAKHFHDISDAASKKPNELQRKGLQAKKLLKRQTSGKL